MGKRTKKKKSLIKQKQHFCYRFSYHLKHCLGLWWLVESYGQTRLELCVLPLQSSWLIFHSFLLKMLTHQFRVPGRVSAVSWATAAGQVPARLPGQLGKWRAETDIKEQLWSWVKEAEPSPGCPLLQDWWIQKDTIHPPNFVMGRTKKSFQVIQTLWPLQFRQGKNVSVAALF